MKNSSKVLSFKQNYNFYENNGVDFALEGQYLKSLSYLFRALKLKPGNIDLLLHLAIVYQKMNLIDASNSMLFKVLSLDNSNENACVLLGQNFSFLGDTLKEIYYLKNFSELTDDVNLLEIFEQSMLAPHYEQVYPLPNATCEMLKLRSVKYLSMGQIDEAKKGFEEILASRPNDIFARNNLCQIYLAEGKFLIVIDYEKQILAAEPENVFALCNLCMAYHLLDECAARDKVVLQLKKIVTKNEEDIKRIAKLMCFIGIHCEAGVWAEKCLSSNEFDVEYITFAAVAFYNSGNYEKSKDYFLKLNKIFPDTIQIEYFLKLVEQTIDGTRLPEVLSFELKIPIEEENKLKKKIHSINFNDVWDNIELESALSWLFNSEQIEIISFALDKLIESNLKRSKKVLANLLAQNHGWKVKSLVIFKMVTQLPKGRIFINKENYFMQLDMPKKAPPKNLTNSFWQAFAVLSVFFLEDEHWLDKLSASAIEVSNGLNAATASVEMSVLPAIIVRNAQLEYEDKQICKFFNVTYEQLVKATDIIFN